MEGNVSMLATESAAQGTVRRNPGEDLSDAL